MKAREESRSVETAKLRDVATAIVSSGREWSDDQLERVELNALQRRCGPMFREGVISIGKPRILGRSSATGSIR